MATVSNVKARAPRLKVLLPGISMLVILSAGFIMALSSPGTFRSPAEKTLWNGHWAAAYEATFNKSLPLREPGVTLWGVLEYGLFREGRSGVLVGEDGWLFSTEEFTFYPDEAAEAAAKLAFIEQVKQQLQRRGTSLTVALVPAKARIYADKLGRYELPGYTLGRYEHFRLALEARGIPAPDLVQPLVVARQKGAVFLKTDTHWTARGAAAAAAALRVAVPTPGLTPSSFTTVLAEAPTRRSGDLLAFIPLGPLQPYLGPEPDTIYQRETVAAATDNGAGLFGDVTIPITLVGTSYSADPTWNFGGALKTAFQVDVLNAAVEGQGPILPMLTYLESKAFRNSPPAILIWEIPERYIPVGDDTADLGGL